VALPNVVIYSELYSCNLDYCVVGLCLLSIFFFKHIFSETVSVSVFRCRAGGSYLVWSDGLSPEKKNLVIQIAIHHGVNPVQSICVVALKQSYNRYVGIVRLLSSGDQHVARVPCMLRCDPKDVTRILFKTEQNVFLFKYLAFFTLFGRKLIMISSLSSPFKD
jgi:hypothetical protein